MKSEPNEELKELTTSTSSGDTKVEKRISVEEIENGYLVIETKEWKDKKEGYKYESKKYYSEKNPLSADMQMMKSIKKNLPGT